MISLEPTRYSTAPPPPPPPPCVDNNLAEAIKSNERWVDPVRHCRLNLRAGERLAEFRSVVGAKSAGEQSARSGYVPGAISVGEQWAVSRSGAGGHSAAGIVRTHGREGRGVAGTRSADDSSRSV